MIKSIRNFIKFNTDLLPIFAVPVACVALLVGIFFGLPYGLGLYPFGPQSIQTITVDRLYVDAHGKSSSYMVASDKGIFEMDNSLVLGIFNIDELYGQLEAGKTYEVTVKGGKLLNIFFQCYPHITTVKEIK